MHNLFGNCESLLPAQLSLYTRIHTHSRLCCAEEHRLYTEWLQLFLAYQSIMMEKLTQASEGGGRTKLHAPAERADTLSLYHLYPCVLCAQENIRLNSNNSNHRRAISLFYRCNSSTTTPPIPSSYCMVRRVTFLRRPLHWRPEDSFSMGHPGGSL
jgi:hypothetical protein